MATALSPARRPLPAAELHRITVDQYHRMMATGVITKDDRCELIHGLLVEKPRINPPHAYAVRALMRLLFAQLGASTVVRIQLPITLADSEPEPDAVVAAGTDDDYRVKHPGPAEVLLVVEVSDASLPDDHGTKLRLYAAESLPVYWIVNIPDRRVEVYTDPRGGKAPTYRGHTDYAPGQSVPVTVAGKNLGSIPVSELLPVTYLDNAATSFPKPEGVYRAMDRYAREALANPGRAGHKMAVAAADTLADARHRLNRFFNGGAKERFIFAYNCTDALNIAIKGVVRPGDHVVTTALEHNSVSRPLVALADAGVITLTRVPADASGTVDPDVIRKAITPATRLVAVTHASNVLGTVQPVAEIGLACREASDRVLVLVDAAQTAGVVPIDLQASPIDLLAFPGHKSLFGPTGTGALYVGPRAKPRAWREGGTGGDSTSPTQPTEYPHFLEGGTPNVLGIVGMIAGLDYVEEKTPDAIRRHEVELCDRVRDGLEGAGFEFFGHRDPDRRVGTVSFRGPDGFDSETLGGVLDANFDIAVRAGLHCSPYAHRAVGSIDEGLIRVSPGPFNTGEDVDRLVAALKDVTGAA